MRNFVVAIFILIISFVVESCAQSYSPDTLNLQATMLTPLDITQTSTSTTPTSSPFPTLRPPAITPTFSCGLCETMVYLPNLSIHPPDDPSMPTPYPYEFIPALTPGEFLEWVGLPPYGEGFWPNLGLAIIRSPTSRELWLVALSWNDLHYYVYDRVPFPQLEQSEAFIPFACSRRGEIIYFLSAVVTRPTCELTGDVHYAWRIDPATLTLNMVPTDGIECSCFW